MLIDLILLHLCVSPRLGFPSEYTMVFLCSIFWGWEVVAHVVKIGGIVDDHSLKFLIMLLKGCTIVGFTFRLPSEILFELVYS